MHHLTYHVLGDTNCGAGSLSGFGSPSSVHCILTTIARYNSAGLYSDFLAQSLLIPRAVRVQIEPDSR
jgi:hypothetical protein